MPVTVGRISRDSPVPLYHQVAGHLRELIGSGELAEGEHLPNEIELAQSFTLSRPTMRQALDELVRDGLIVRRRGVGTVVTPQQFHRGARVTSVFEDLVAAGRSPSTVVLSVGVVDGPLEVATAFDLRQAQRVVALEGLRSADDVPLVLMRNWLPARSEFLASTDLTSRGLYHVMRERGGVPISARKTISACAAKLRTGAIARRSNRRARWLRNQTHGNSRNTSTRTRTPDRRRRRRAVPRFPRPEHRPCRTVAAPRHRHAAVE